MSDLVERALAEDIGEGDLTTRAVVPEGARALAVIRQKEPGVIAGMGVMREVFLHVDPELEYEAHCPEAKWREEGTVAQVTGAAASILAAERVALNFLGRLSGVATLTARYVRAVEGTGARILDTRKTTPGLRDLEKAAVRAGGGMSHRRGLYDAILVKENHSALAGGVGAAARLALEAAPELARAAGRDSIRSRSSARRSTRSRRRSRRASPGSCWTTCRSTSCARRWSLRTGAPSSRRRAASRSTRSARWPRPGWTTSASARSRTRRPALDVSLLLEPL